MEQEQPTQRLRINTVIARRTRRLAGAAALATAPLLLVMADPAQAQSFYDSLTFQTTDQSLWSSGGASGWSYDSGFIGGTWGGGASAASPVNLGFNGIAGSAHALITPAVASQQISPAVPGYTIPGVPPVLISPAVYTAAVPATYKTIPAVYSAAVAATYTPRVCVLHHCTGHVQITPYIPPKLITPASTVQLTPAIPPKLVTPAVYTPAVAPVVVAPVPAVYSPAVPAVYGDTRTGASVAVKSSGALGFDVKASATAGAVNVVLPVQASLNLPAQFVQGQAVHVAGSTTIGSAAHIDVTAPSFRGGVTGIIDTTNELGVTACVAAAGCTSGSVKPTLHQTVDIVSVNTAAAQPAMALGMALPLGVGQDTPVIADGQTVAHVTVTAPMNRSGGAVSGQSLTLGTHQSVLKTTADLGGIAQVALGDPADELQPSLSAGPASIHAVLVNLQGGVDLGMTQRLSFGMDVDVTLRFDQAVTMTYHGQTLAPSTQVTFDLDEGADLSFEGKVGHLLSRTYSISPDSLFSNSTSLSIDPLFQIKAACYDLAISGVYSHSQCLLDKAYGTTDLIDVNVFDKQFALQGFNQVAFQTPVPEPERWALMLVGLAGLAVRRKRLSA